jgi:hypothetical protein
VDATRRWEWRWIEQRGGDFVISHFQFTWLTVNLFTGVLGVEVRWVTAVAPGSRVCVGKAA